MKRIFLCALFFAGNCSVSASEQPVDHVATAASAFTAISLISILRDTLREGIVKKKHEKTLRHAPQLSNTQLLTEAGTVVLAAISFASLESGHTNIAAFAAFGGALTCRWSVRFAEQNMDEAVRVSTRLNNNALKAVAGTCAAEEDDDIEDVPVAVALLHSQRADLTKVLQIKRVHRHAQRLLLVTSGDDQDAAQAAIGKAGSTCGVD